MYEPCQAAGEGQPTRTTTFFYDDAGNRTRTLYPDGTNVYTPFPDYEEEVPPGANPTITQRVTFSANGQPAAVWKKVGGGAAVRYSLHTNHLGSVVAVGNANGGLEANSYAAYEPFGAFMVQPSGANPDHSTIGLLQLARLFSGRQSTKDLTSGRPMVL